MDTLDLAYRVYGLSADAELTAEQVDLVVRTFALFFVMPLVQEYWHSPDLVKTVVEHEAAELYAGWTEFVMLIDDLRHEAERQDVWAHFGGTTVRRDFRYVVSLVDLITTRFGRFSDRECRQMKNTLLDLEPERADGRVPLGKFYGATLQGAHSGFSESPAYLRHLGALDEQDPWHPQVVVPNVLYGPSNCVASSGFHSVCCVDDCQVLMTGLEQRLLRPSAVPSAIAEAVRELRSETVAAPRQLTPDLVRRLEDIAKLHGGGVPLHGRLFQQWMHHAFPGECALPRLGVGGEPLLAPTVWMAKHNDSQHYNSKVTDAERAAAAYFLSDHRCMGGRCISSPVAVALPWAADEAEKLLGADRPRLPAAAAGPRAFSLPSLHAVVGCLSIFAAVRSLLPVIAAARGRPAAEKRPALHSDGRSCVV